jgi:hypothetical protein
VPWLQNIWSTRTGAKKTDLDLRHDELTTITVQWSLNRGMFIFMENSRGALQCRSIIPYNSPCQKRIVCKPRVGGWWVQHVTTCYNPQPSPISLSVLLDLTSSKWSYITWRIIPRSR